MNCLKCGVKIKSPAVFCDGCLAGQARRPVPRDAVAVLPDRTRPKRSPRRAHSKLWAEEEVILLRRQVRNQRIALGVLLACFLVALAIGLYFGIGDFHNHAVIGQNYQSTAPSSISATE